MLREVEVDVDLPARYLLVKLSDRPWDDFLTNILPNTRSKVPKSME